MTIRQDRTRFIRRAFMLSFSAAALVITVMAVVPSPTAEAGKPGGSTGGTRATLVVAEAPGGDGFNVIVSGSGFSARKRVRVDAFGPSPAPLRDVTVTASGTFSYSYILPDPDEDPELGPDSWTFEAFEEARGGWKLKASAKYTNYD